MNAVNTTWKRWTLSGNVCVCVCVLLHERNGRNKDARQSVWKMSVRWKLEWCSCSLVYFEWIWLLARTLTVCIACAQCAQCTGGECKSDDAFWQIFKRYFFFISFLSWRSGVFIWSIDVMLLLLLLKLTLTRTYVHSMYNVRRSESQGNWLILLLFLVHFSCRHIARVRCTKICSHHFWPTEIRMSVCHAVCEWVDSFPIDIV